MGSFLSRVTANKHRKAGAEALDAFLPGSPTVHLFYVALQWGLMASLHGKPANQESGGGEWHKYKIPADLILFFLKCEMARIATELNLHNS